MNCTNCGHADTCFFTVEHLNYNGFCPGWTLKETEQPNHKRLQQTGEDGFFEVINVPFEVIP